MRQLATFLAPHYPSTRDAYRSTLLLCIALQGCSRPTPPAPLLEKKYASAIRSAEFIRVSPLNRSIEEFGEEIDPKAVEELARTIESLDFEVSNGAVPWPYGVKIVCRDVSNGRDLTLVVYSPIAADDPIAFFAIYGGDPDWHNNQLAEAYSNNPEILRRLASFISSDEIFIGDEILNPSARNKPSDNNAVFD